MDGQGAISDETTRKPDTGAQDGPYEDVPETSNARPESSGPDDVAPAEDATGADADAAGAPIEEDLSEESSGFINQEMPLTVVARAESTTTFLLAQTLGSTKSVPVVSAKLPLDDDLSVVGSFEYRGITYAVEPGGGSVAIVAVDPNKLPSDFIEAQTIVLPSAVSIEGADPYSVTRIAEGAFSSLNGEAARSTGELSDELAAGEADDGEADPAADREEPIGITAITIPASVTTIDDGAFTGFETLQYVIVSVDNPNYSMYDGCLYDKPQQSLLLIPGGRLGAVRVARKTMEIAEDVPSHCAYLTSLIVDPNSAASQLLEGKDFYNANDDKIDVIAESQDSFSRRDFEHREEGAGEAAGGDASDLETSVVGSFDQLEATYSEVLEIEVDSAFDLYDHVGIESADAGSTTLVVSNGALRVDDGNAIIVASPGQYALGVVVRDGMNVARFVVMDIIVSGESDDAATTKMGFSEKTTKGATDTNSYSLAVDGYMQLLFAGTTRSFFAGSMTGTVSWTAGTASAPGVGSIVSVDVSAYRPTGGETTKEQLVGAGIGWGGSASQELIGVRNVGTGSYTSLETIYSGDQFSFSFIMPASGCLLDSGQLVYRSAPDDSNFQPVFAFKSNAIYNTFLINGAGGSWKNPHTGITSNSASYSPVTYSEIGGSLVAPTDSIPVRPGYMFTGWYTDPSGGTIVPDIALVEDNGKDYYAHWVETRRSITYENKKIQITTSCKSGRSFVADSAQFCGTVTWSSDTDTPTVGSYVSIQVTKYRPNGGETTRDMLVGAGIENWGGDETQELVGIKNSGTGSYVSLDALYSGDAFALSFIMPDTGQCYINANEIRWYDPENGTSFDPVFRPRENAIYSYFHSNGGLWENPATNTLAVGNSYGAITYSNIGEAFIAPANSVLQRPGYAFAGWYTDPEGGELLSGEATADDNGKAYYAHWMSESHTMDIRGYGAISPKGSGRCFLADTAQFEATASWETGTSSMPAPGAVVSVRVTKYRPNGGETTKDSLINASMEWGGDRTRKLVGIRNTDTGMYVSAETLYSGDTFVLSFVMPSSGITFSPTMLVWKNTTTFEPVFEECANAIVNHFEPNGSGTYWVNPTTGQSGSPSQATTYSNIGGAILSPSSGFVMRTGYIFTGWFTEPVGGHIVSGLARAEDNGKTYYAHWGNKDSVYYFLKLHGNGANIDNPITWSVEAGTQFSLAARIFDKVGHSITSYTSNADGTGDKYQIETLYNAFANNSTTNLYAQWTLDTYKMSYDLAGGTEAQGGSYPQEYSYGEGTIEVSDPVRPGYEFLGWVGTGLASPTKGLSVDRASNDKLGAHAAGSALYERSYQATWRAYSYDLELYDGDVSVSSQQDLAYGQPHDIDASAFASRKPGYHVSGWKIGEPSSALEIAGEKGPVPATFDEAAPAHDGDVVRLYCIWEGNPYKVRFFDGSELKSEQTGLVYGTPSALDSQTDLFRKDDLSLVGWAYSHEDADYGMNANAVEVALDAVVSTFEGREPAKEGGVLDLYAVWAPVITASVPLQSSIAFDPDRPYAPAAFKAGTASITTSGRLALKVSSLALERTEGSSDGSTLGTSDIFSVAGTDRSSSVELTVEGDRPDGTSSSPLTLNLGADGQKVPSAAHGMGAFDKERPLNLSFGLTFLPGCPDPSSFEALSDPSFKDAYEQDGSRKAYRMARLLFTLEMAPPLS